MDVSRDCRRRRCYLDCVVNGEMAMVGGGSGEAAKRFADNSERSTMLLTTAMV